MCREPSALPVDDKARARPGGKAAPAAWGQRARSERRWGLEISVSRWRYLLARSRSVGCDKSTGDSK